MITIRCTQKLLSGLGRRPAPDAPAPMNRLGDWYANVMNLGRERLILCVSEKTLLPVVLSAAGARIDFAQRLAAGVRETLNALGIPGDAVDEELAHFGEVTFAKTANRSVVGSMVDLQYMAQHIRAEQPSAPLLFLGLELAKEVCLSLEHTYPSEATRIVMGAEPAQRQPVRATTPLVNADLPKSVKKKLRELEGLAYHRELSAALSALEAEFKRWRAGELSPFELSDRIHRFHDGEARELWKRYDGRSLEWTVSDALQRKIVTEAEVGPEVMTLLSARLRA